MCSLFYKSKYFFKSLHQFEYVNTEEHKQNENFNLETSFVFLYFVLNSIIYTLDLQYWHQS